MSGILVAEAVVLLRGLDQVAFGLDYLETRRVGEQWLADGTMYQPYQLAGPYEMSLNGFGGPVDTYYPPSALLLFVPSVFAPPVLWWAIPIAVLGYTIWRWQPAMWAIVAMLVLFAWPRAMAAFPYGSTDIWMAAFVAGGLMWRWPSVGLFLKPSFAPLAFIGVRDRRWWFLVGLGLVFIVLTFPLWMDWLTVLRNLGPLPLTYSLGSLPLLAIPIVAWLGRTRLRQSPSDAPSPA